MSSKNLSKESIKFEGYKITFSKDEETYPSGRKQNFFNIQVRKNNEFVDEFSFPIED